MDYIRKNLLPLIFSLGVLLITFVAGLELIIFNDSYFEWHYTTRGVTETTGMTVRDLMWVTEEMLDYLKGQRPNLDMQAPVNGVMEEVFGEREKAHMVDVKDLYLGFRSLRRVSIVIVLGLLLYGWFKDKQLLQQILGRVKIFIPLLLVVIGVLGGLFATDFTRYFTLFHEIFFDNDLWLLNPKTDILINMVPEIYFYSIVMIGLSLFAVMIGLSVALCTYGAGKLKRFIENT